MSTATTTDTTVQSQSSDDLAAQCADVARRAKAASRVLGTLDTTLKDQWLIESADALVNATDKIVAANQLDLEHAPKYGLTDAQVDRLKLDRDRIDGIATGLREIAALKDPIGEVLDGFTRPGGMQIEKRRVPLGVVFFIYESRPNVTADAAGICVKSGNAVILRGGKEAMHSSRAIVDVMHEVAKSVGIPNDAVQLVGTTDRAAVGHFLKLSDSIDVTIPRGGENLIRRVAAEATMPVIKHYDGNCHVYVDESADIEMAVNIIENAKCQRMGVCNACESLLVHESIAKDALPAIAERLTGRGVEMRVDERAAAFIPDGVPATESDFGAEFLGPQISVAVVDSLEKAAEHINHYGSGHTDAIVTSQIAAADRFTALVDSSAVMVNASTRFNDGGMFGLGAEIGISTDKFHARGPCGLRELTSYKYIVRGNGHIRG
ncbi:glutamate-5-semialdehyde dehydrogenase [Rhodopirellula halodulae]|uniref:glutamate-5-semialdehyde dehydrogenase n=1 Tax=Rhodopirellula halodulae TaxID=2894198 RepID=UPI001E2ED89E|nr:glutamate-5-semialdehyde dehydrogenase [Rhodopirellula sp. JC737]MCC9657530.1 glutamate-5-semialdehyde dehydrogenase [Rhodopirellula sp. JC737]